jgi:hypothetical protein
MTERPGLSKRQCQVLDSRDQALLAEVRGYLRGLASQWNSDEKAYDWALVLSSRIRDLELKLWPLDRLPMSERP